MTNRSIVDEKRLISMRGQIHLAVQCLAAVGISYLPKKEDDSHTAMEWNDQLRAFISRTFGKENSLQLGFGLSSGQFLLLERGDRRATLDIHRKTIPEIQSSLKQWFANVNLDPDSYTLEKHYALPAYDERLNTPFDVSDQEALEAFSDVYHSAYSALIDIRSDTWEFTPIFIWPHHFDMARLLVLERDKHGEMMRTIGLGVSPGDDNMPAPYGYITPWPNPENQVELPDLEGAFWQNNPWVGYVLPYESIEKGSPLLFEEYFTNGIHHLRKIIY